MTKLLQTYVFGFLFTDYFSHLTRKRAIQLIIVTGVIIFLNGLINPFIADDLAQITQNPGIHSLGNIPTFFIGSGTSETNAMYIIGTFYRPIVLTFFSLIYATFGEHAFFFHLFQLPFFICNAIFVYLLFEKYLSRTAAWILALFFLVHPTNSSMALYIADVQDTLYFFFGMLGLLILHKNSSLKSVFLVVMLLMLSLFSKESGILFIGITLIYAYIFKRNTCFMLSGILLVVIPFYLILRLSTMGMYLHTSSSPIAALTFHERLINIPSIIYFYIHAFLYPFDLSMIYQWRYTQIDIPHFFIPLGIDLSMLLFILFLVYILWKSVIRPKFKIFTFFLLWFIIGISLHLQFIPLDATVAHRWWYFPMVGLLGMIGLLSSHIPKTVPRSFLGIICLLIFIALGLRSFLRTFDWRNEITLASADLRVSPDSYSLESQLSYGYFKRGEFKKAKIHAERSIALYPTIINYYNLGAAKFSLKDHTGAKEAFLKSLQYGENSQVYENLAYIGILSGDPKENITFIKQKALKKFPTNGKLWFYLAILEYNFGDKKNALLAIKNAYHYSPSKDVIDVYTAITQNTFVRIKN